MIISSEHGTKITQLRVVHLLLSNPVILRLDPDKMCTVEYATVRYTNCI